jgi:hypothetical protein
MGGIAVQQMAEEGNFGTHTFLPQYSCVIERPQVVPLEIVARHVPHRFHLAEIEYQPILIHPKRVGWPALGLTHCTEPNLSV